METISDTGNPGDIWNQKPFWCQPWTIVLTGVLIIAGSWVLLHRWWITVPVGGAIGLWWWTFLVMMPRLVREMDESSQTITMDSLSPNDDS